MASFDRSLDFLILAGETACATGYALNRFAPERLSTARNACTFMVHEVSKGQPQQIPARWEKGCGKSERTCRPSAQRALLCLYRGHLVALHGFIKKTRTTPNEDLGLARERQKELER